MTGARPSRTLFNLLLALAGAALLYFTVRTVGWADVQAGVNAIGWWFVAVVALGGLRFAARARAWVVCTEGQLPMGAAFRAVLVGDALGNLTPLGLLASEPAKVLFIRGRIPTVAAVASVAAENAFYMASVVVMIAAGAVTFFEVASVPPAIRPIAQGALVAAVTGALLAVWAIRRRPAILTRLARVVATSSGRAATSVERLREIEIHFYALVTWPAGRLAHVMLWEALFHVCAVTEVYLTLRLIAPTATIVDAFVLETAGRLVVVAFKFVPYRLGVDEAAGAVVARALMMEPTVGVTLSLVRRMRILFWNFAGLFLLALKRG